ncbi:MAG: ubiquinone/menaquinone biosynthesis methyltransferase [Armatimonadota bacterium]
MVETKQQIPVWETQDTEKGVAVHGLFSRIAKDYDVANRILSFNRDNQWRELAVSKLNLNPNESVLDLCCGTGDFLPILRGKVGDRGEVVGIDFCEPMISQASAKDENSLLIVGDACELPFEDERFNGISVGWGIRNVNDIQKAHAEAFRTLKSGGRFVSIDCAEPKSKFIRSFTGIGRTALTSILGRSLKSKDDYRYLNESSKRFKSRQELTQIMQAAGFTEVQFQDLMFGNICIHWGLKP